MSITIYLLDEWLRFIIGKRAAGWKWTSSSANPNECGPNPNSSKSDRSFASVYGLVVIRARAERNSEQPKEWQWAREWVANNNSKKSLTTVMVTGASPYNDATENTHALFSVAVFRSLPNGSCRLFSSFLPIRRVSICVLAFFCASWFVCDICPRFSCSTNMCLVLICVCAVRFSIGGGFIRLSLSWTCVVSSHSNSTPFVHIIWYGFRCNAYRPMVMIEGRRQQTEWVRVKSVCVCEG